MDFRFQISDFRLRTRSVHLPRSFRNPQSALRKGISLIEVLISMFVLLFGLMGVAAIFPVGNHYVVEGEKFDLGAAIAQNAFEELKGRGLLQTEVWHYADPKLTLAGETITGPHNDAGEFETQVMQPPTVGPASAAPTPRVDVGRFNLLVETPANAPAPGPGHAFVIDPLATALTFDDDQVNDGIDLFPRYTAEDDLDDVLNRLNPWHPNILGVGAVGSQQPLSGTRWPVRRITVLDATGLMSSEVAETIFRLRDDLAVEQPDKSDRPSIQRWDTDTAGTLEDPTDDALLRRQYKGDYSWLATIVPTTNQGRLALQPASEDYGEIACDVSVVVFRKRVETPTSTSERLLEAELLAGGELILYSTSGGDLAENRELVDQALDDVRPGNWISVMGVNQSSGDFVMKWYRLLSLEDESETREIDFSPWRGTAATVVGRRAMVIGPDWPEPLNNIGNDLGYSPNLRVGLFPGAISVVTKPLRMENTSLWNLQ